MNGVEGERISLGRNLKARGNVEQWLSVVEHNMRQALQVMPGFSLGSAATVLCCVVLCVVLCCVVLCCVVLCCVVLCCVMFPSPSSALTVCVLTLLELDGWWRPFRCLPRRAGKTTL